MSSRNASAHKRLLRLELHSFPSVFVVQRTSQSCIRNSTIREHQGARKRTRFSVSTNHAIVAEFGRILCLQATKRWNLQKIVLQVVNKVAREKRFERPTRLLPGSVLPESVGAFQRAYDRGGGRGEGGEDGGTVFHRHILTHSAWQCDVT